jgi:hypothetical protein
MESIQSPGAICTYNYVLRMFLQEHFFDRQRLDHYPLAAYAGQTRLLPGIKTARDIDHIPEPGPLQ